MNNKKVKVAINWYWRIGICVAKIISKRDDVKLVAINSSAEYSDLIYMTKFDSVHWQSDLAVKIENNKLCIWENLKAEILSDRNPETLDFWKTWAEIVLECTGQFLTKESAKAHLKNWVKKVLFSAPAKDDTKTLVIWVNEDEFNWEDFISNASCTTNCLGPITKLIDDEIGIEKAIMTTIHSYTASQNVLDNKNPKDKRKWRAAALNMIPTTTGAAKAITKIMPKLIWKIHGQAVRVPTPNVSLVDVNYVLKKDISKEEILKILNNASENKYKNIIEIDTEFKVSSDLCWNPASAIIASDMTQVIDWNLLKIMAWYDNEWGYSSRLVDMAVLIGR